MREIVFRNLDPSNSVHPSQTVNDGMNDGTDGGTHRPKPFYSSRSGPLHTDTLSVSRIIPGGDLTIPAASPGCGGCP